MPGSPDALTLLAPLLRVRPELQDFCRFGGTWRAAHAPEEKGWAAFHIVTKGTCVVDRAAHPAIRLAAGDVLLLPHGDAHVVYSSGPDEDRQVRVTQRDYIRIKQSEGVAIETELICGRLHLETGGENLLVQTLPHVVVLPVTGLRRCSEVVTAIREELEMDRGGAAAITRDLASALFVMLLRAYFEAEPPLEGLLALLGHRETGKAAAAMLGDPARNWGLDELASIAAVSRATLVRAFRRISGMPPKAFLTELRLGIARHRIAQTSGGLGQIAADVGYESEAALSRALYRRFAIRPGAVRQAARAAAEILRPA